MVGEVAGGVGREHRFGLRFDLLHGESLHGVCVSRVEIIISALCEQRWRSNTPNRRVGTAPTEGSVALYLTSDAAQRLVSRRAPARCLMHRRRTFTSRSRRPPLTGRQPVRVLGGRLGLAECRPCSSCSGACLVSRSRGAKRCPSRRGRSACVARPRFEGVDRTELPPHGRSVPLYMTSCPSLMLFSSRAPGSTENGKRRKK